MEVEAQQFNSDSAVNGNSPFLEFKTIVENGDLVIIWVSRSDLRAVKITSGETLQTKFGPFRHDHIIGRRYGSQIASMSGPGFVHVLQPTPELWAQSLPHRTQIVYSPDASYIVQRLGIRPGSHVVEAGTGSGALTHVLARTIGKSGKVFTFEYHAERWAQAKQEFIDHGIYEEPVIATHRNVCEDGFEIENCQLGATAIFLDLPAPWTAIPRVRAVVNESQGASICCFSPCIEQVIKSIHALQQAGFRSIETVENQANRFEGHRLMVRTLDESLDIMRDMRNRRQIAIERRKASTESREDTPLEDKTPKEDDSKDESETVKYNPWGRGKRIKEGEDPYNWRPISWVETQLKSHTAYLTFAVLPPTDSD